MIPIFAILISLVGLSPDETNKNILHPRPSGGLARESRESFRCADALDHPMKEIPLTNSLLTFQIDDEDYEKVMRYKTWQINADFSITHCTSFGTKETSASIIVSRLIMDAAPGVLVDHRDGNRLDNRRSNLRFANKSQNGQNSQKRRVPNSSRFKGVIWDRSRHLWRAYINLRSDGITRQKHLGRFETEIEAATAYNLAAEKYFGEFARPNPL